MDKVTLTKEQAEAIEFALNTKRLAYFKSPETLLQSHIRSRHFLDEMYHLREIDSVTLAKALFVGYLVEVTPEEEIKSHWDNSDPDDSLEEYDKGFRCGILRTLEAFDIKVKGIND